MNDNPINIAAAIKHIAPSAVPNLDFLVQDDSDGRGPYLAAWTIDAPKPTDEEITAAWEAVKAIASWDGVRAQRAPLLEEADVQFNKALDQGKDTKTISTYRQALRDITKGPDPLSPAWPQRPW